MQLEFEHRCLLNICVARARIYERQQLTIQAEQLRAEIAAERDAMLAEMAKIKAEMLAPFFELRAELDAAHAELAKLRLLNARAQAQREEIWRDRMLVKAMCAQRDESTLLQ